MEFKLSTRGFFYNEKKEMELLETLGFKFKFYKNNNFIIKGTPIININSLEELIELSKKFNCQIIVSDKRIEIYDNC